MAQVCAPRPKWKPVFLVIRNCHTPKIDLVIKVVVVLIRRGLFRLNNINKLCLVYRTVHTINRKFLDGCRQPTSSSSTLSLVQPQTTLLAVQGAKSEIRAI